MSSAMTTSNPVDAKTTRISMLSASEMEALWRLDHILDVVFPWISSFGDSAFSPEGNELDLRRCAGSVPFVPDFDNWACWQTTKTLLNLLTDLNNKRRCQYEHLCEHLMRDQLASAQMILFGPLPTSLHLLVHF